MSYKKVKFEQQIMDQLNQIMRQQIRDPRLTFVSITRVELSDDFSYANVYWDTFDATKRGDAKAAIESSIGKLRKFLGQGLKVRHTPQLKAVYDSQYDEEMKISELLDKEKERLDNGEE